MTLHNELKTAIVALWDNITFTTDTPLYYVEAPQTTDYQYAVFSFFADTYSFDSGNEWEEVYFQIAIYNDNNSSGQVGVTESEVIEAFKTTLTTTNYTQIQLVRLNKRYAQSEDDVWQTIIEYRVEFQHD